MKKITICTILIAAGAVSLMSASPKLASVETDLGFQKMAAITLGYDKSMSEKTIKAAVIDSYFRKVCQNGKIVRWNKNSLPLKVYIQDSKDVPTYYREVVMSAYQAWQRASEGLVRFEFVESPSEANMKCYFKHNDNKNSIGVHAFSVNGNRITDSNIVFNKVDNKEITTTSTPTTKDFNEGDILSARWENGRGTHREGKDELASDTRAVPLPVDDTRRAEEGCLGGLWSRPKMSVRVWGADGVVTMTEEQYETLVSLVGEDTLGLYIERLEALILKVNGGVYPHSQYRTLREWLTEDFST